MKQFFKQSQISAFRLTRHHLAEQNQADLTTVCRNVCGIQAQVMSAARMALWARMPGLTQADIHLALWKSRTLVKTSCMRQTLHLIPAADFSVYINALKRSRVEALRRILSRFGVTYQEAETMNQAVVEALADGPMTRPALIAHLTPRVGKKMRTYMEHVWSIQIFRPALVEGLICYGPEQGKKATFVRVEQWLPEQRKVSEQEAQRILLRRFLSVYGPALPQDFSRWTGIPMKETRAVWQHLAEELLEVSIEDKKGFILREDYDQLTNRDHGDPILRLLPGFDPYMLGHVDKNHLVDSTYYKRVYRNQGWISPVVLLNGRVIGIWSYTRRGQRLSLEIEPFEKFSKIIQLKIEEEATRLGGFLEAFTTTNFLC
ncbi:MAG: winged helix DNA-binding domain-containing protein [bacterium]